MASHPLKPFPRTVSRSWLLPLEKLETFFFLIVFTLEDFGSTILLELARERVNLSPVRKMLSSSSPLPLLYHLPCHQKAAKEKKLKEGQHFGLHLYFKNKSE